MKVSGFRELQESSCGAVVSPLAVGAAVTSLLHLIHHGLDLFPRTCKGRVYRLVIDMLVVGSGTLSLSSLPWRARMRAPACPARSANCPLNSVPRSATITTGIPKVLAQVLWNVLQVTGFSIFEALHHRISRAAVHDSGQETLSTVQDANNPCWFVHPR